MSIAGVFLGRLRRFFVGETPAVVLYEDLAAHYGQVLLTKGLTAKTIDKKRCAHRYMVEAFQGRDVRSIRPWEIAKVIKGIHDLGYWVTSHKALIEARAAFGVALLEGWVDNNPAEHVKRLPAPVRRRRLTLDLYAEIYEYARRHLPPWAGLSMRLALVTGQRRADLVRMGDDDVWDEHLHVVQQKTGAMVAIPLALQLDALGTSVGEVLRECVLSRPAGGHTFLCTAARPRRLLHPQTVTHRFWVARRAVLPDDELPGTPPTFHELRSLSARLYAAQGVDAQVLLGHKRQRMTDVYIDDRGLGRGQWRYVELPSYTG